MTPRTRSAAQRATPTLGYASVAAGEPLDGPAIEEQRHAIEDACERLNLRLVDLVRDHQGNGEPSGLRRVLERIGAGEASCLIVSDLERLTRKTTRLESVLDRLDRDNARLVALDVGLDSATEAGRLAVTPVGEPPGTAPEEYEVAQAPEPAVVSEPEPEPALQPAAKEPAPAPVARAERQRAPERTRRAAPRRGRGSVGASADLETIRARIASMREDGMTLQAIADALNEEGVPTLRGGARWRPSSVQTAAGYRRPPRSTGSQRP
jgi:Resolvase, N terminal domain/Recombinase